MKDISSPKVQRDVLLRIGRLSPGDQARWGRMTVHQMVCHLNDAYRAVLANKTLAPINLGIPRPLLKWIALRVPVRWPKDVPAPREIAQGLGGTQPIDFGHDRAELVGSLKEFCLRTPPAHLRHPLFGNMSEQDWLRWAYLHADHHLRQFGR